LSGWLVQHGGQAFQLANIVAIVLIIVFRRSIAKCVVEVRLREYGNLGTPVGDLCRDVLRQLESIRDRCDDWRDILTISALTFSLTGELGDRALTWL
jgi:hypothetical protein